MVSPDVSRQVPVPSLATGRVVEIDAQLGDEVKKGQLLFRVPSSDIAGAFSDYRKAVNNEELTKVQLERAQPLFDHGAVPNSVPGNAENAEQDANLDSGNHSEHLRLLGVDPNHPTDRRCLCSRLGHDHRPADHQRVRRAGSVRAQSLHHFRHVARLDYLRRV